jgi:hypothetical protein
MTTRQAQKTLREKLAFINFKERKDAKEDNYKSNLTFGRLHFLAICVVIMMLMMLLLLLVNEFMATVHLVRWWPWT